MDFEISCDKGVLTFTKMKDGEEPEPIEFKLLPVQIGTDENGEPVTSCIVEYGERSERHKSSVYTNIEKLAIKALVNASSVTTKVEEGGKYGALIGDWRQAFYDLRRAQEPDLSVNTLTRAFKRASESLIEKGAVHQAGHARLLASQDHQADVSAAIFTENMLNRDKGH
jgi:hypothetical protein